MSKSSSISLKFVFVGDLNCGKTCLFNRMSFNKFQPQNNFLSPDYAFSIIKHEKKTVRITFWDTVAQQKYQHVKPKYYENANVVFACFDLSTKILVENIELWLDQIGKHMCDETFIAIVGCKGDLMENQKNEKTLMKIAEKYQYQYFKTSSWTGEGVKDLMDSSLESCIYAAQNEEKKVNKPKKQQKKKVKIDPETNNAYSATSILRKSKEEQKNQKLYEQSQSQLYQSQTEQSQQSSQILDKTKSSNFSKTSFSNKTKTITSTYSNAKSRIQSKENSNPSQNVSSRKPTPLSSQKSSGIALARSDSSSENIMQYPQSD